MHIITHIIMKHGLIHINPKGCAQAPQDYVNKSNNAQRLGVSSNALIVVIHSQQNNAKNTPSQTEPVINQLKNNIQRNISLGVMKAYDSDHYACKQAVYADDLDPHIELERDGSACGMITLTLVVAITETIINGQDRKHIQDAGQNEIHDRGTNLVRKGLPGGIKNLLYRGGGGLIRGRRSDRRGKGDVLRERDEGLVRGGGVQHWTALRTGGGKYWMW